MVELMSSARPLRGGIIISLGRDSVAGAVLGRIELLGAEGREKVELLLIAEAGGGAGAGAGCFGDFPTAALRGAAVRAVEAPFFALLRAGKGFRAGVLAELAGRFVEELREALFLVALFLAGLFLAALFLAGLFLAALFLAALFLAGLFLAALFLATLFLAGLFLAALFLAGLFLAALFLAGLFLAALFLAALFLAGLFLGALFLGALFLAGLFLAGLFLAALFLLELFEDPPRELRDLEELFLDAAIATPFYWSGETAFNNVYPIVRVAKL